MPEPKPRIRAAIAFARNFAAGIVENAEPIWQQCATTLTDAEMEIVNQELERIAKRLEASINQDALAQAISEK